MATHQAHQDIHIPHHGPNTPFCESWRGGFDAGYLGNPKPVP
jgi:hypothetical protein